MRNHQRRLTTPTWTRVEQAVTEVAWVDAGETAQSSIELQSGRCTHHDSVGDQSRLAGMAGRVPIQ